ncbi:hypothetical protein D3C86_2205990 [compost metagenome]
MVSFSSRSRIFFRGEDSIMYEVEDYIEFPKSVSQDLRIHGYCSILSESIKLSSSLLEKLPLQVEGFGKIKTD